MEGNKGKREKSSEEEIRGGIQKNTKEKQTATTLVDLTTLPVQL